jgi:hypothetical protein
MAEQKATEYLLCGGKLRRDPSLTMDFANRRKLKKDPSLTMFALTREKRREIPRSGSSLGMSILIGCSL